MTSDNFPVPLSISKLYSFPLQHLHDEGDWYFAAQDWLVGLGSRNPRNYWMIARREMRLSIRKYPYAATNGKSYLMAYLDLPNLLALTGRYFRYPYQTWSEFSEVSLLRSKPIYLYVISLKDAPGYYKIGTSTTPETRLAQIRTDNPFSPYICALRACDLGGQQERELHSRFAPYRVDGEWYKLPSSERDSLLSLVT